MLTVVVSGPRASEAAVRALLADAGCVVDPFDGNRYGLPETKSGEAASEPVAFVELQVDGDDPTPTRDLVEARGWELRVQHPTEQPGVQAQEIPHYGAQG